MGRMYWLPICTILAMLRWGDVMPAENDIYANLRARMVKEQMAARDITDERVLAAMRKVPQHRFVPDRELRFAYADTPLPIGEGQTISQPYIVGRLHRGLFAVIEVAG